MEPKINIIEALVGNLNISPNVHISRETTSSPGAGSRLRNSTQINQLVILMHVDGKEIQTVVDTAEIGKKRNETFKEGYHAVFLSSGQVYFGKLELIEGKRFVKLKDIFYLRSGETPVEEGQAGINLVKLGQELHGPHDAMNVNVDHITFWEKLRDDGPVVVAILDYYRELDS